MDVDADQTDARARLRFPEGFPEELRNLACDPIGLLRIEPLLLLHVFHKPLFSLASVRNLINALLENDWRPAGYLHSVVRVSSFMGAPVYQDILSDEIRKRVIKSDDLCQGYLESLELAGEILDAEELMLMEHHIEISDAYYYLHLAPRDWGHECGLAALCDADYSESLPDSVRSLALCPTNHPPSPIFNSVSAVATLEQLLAADSPHLLTGFQAYSFDPEDAVDAHWQLRSIDIKQLIERKTLQEIGKASLIKGLEALELHEDLHLKSYRRFYVLELLDLQLAKPMIEAIQKVKKEAARSNCGLLVLTMLVVALIVIAKICGAFQ